MRDKGNGILSTRLTRGIREHGRPLIMNSMCQLKMKGGEKSSGGGKLHTEHISETRRNGGRWGGLVLDVHLRVRVSFGETRKKRGGKVGPGQAGEM